MKGPYLYSLIAIVSVWGISAHAAPAVLVEDPANPPPAESRATVQETKTATGVFELREQRRFGVGANLLGWSGFIGADFEANLLDDQSVRIAVGGGPGYQSISGGWKYLLTDSEVHPFIGFGLADWFGSLTAGQSSASPPSWLNDRVITSADRANGHFAHFFYTPSVGAEWLQIHGPNTGAAVYAEVMFMIETATLAPFPTVNVGAHYYF